ncbi:hypothetical protein MKW98_018396 [Papaver atlanticum]|uniref:Large ribosomal subunit protein uL23 N-terminal domain-containing protein n=1 Tax=Papaver atlanticum TaxID=357466 RepID=A0AAD4T3J7_9MAGN|nr:hypothetical protein MKW98_018396 [Papaver atlanticum]
MEPVVDYTFTKKAGPKVLANKAAKDVKVEASTIKKKDKKIRTSITFHRPKTLQKARNPKYPCISALQRNKLDHYQILKYPLTTESARLKTTTRRKSKMYNIQTEKVNTLINVDRFTLCPDYLLRNYSGLGISEVNS